MVVSKAFSLIELMIVITIIGILAAVAVPAYQDYVIRAKVVEGLVLAQKQKQEVNEYFSINGKIPTTNDNSEITIVNNPNSNISYIRYVSTTGLTHNQYITIVFIGSAIGEAANRSLNLAPVVSNGNIEWKCLNSKAGTVYVIPDSKLPGNCLEKLT